METTCGEHVHGDCVNQWTKFRIIYFVLSSASRCELNFQWLLLNFEFVFVPCRSVTIDVNFPLKFKLIFLSAITSPANYIYIYFLRNMHICNGWTFHGKQSEYTKSKTASETFVCSLFVIVNLLTEIHFVDNHKLSKFAKHLLSITKWRDSLMHEISHSTRPRKR